MKCIKILKYLQWMSMKGHKNHDKCTNQVLIPTPGIAPKQKMKEATVVKLFTL